MNHDYSQTDTPAEITLDTEAGLELLAEHIDELRTDIENLQAAYYDRYEAVADSFVEAGTVYQTLRELVIDAVEILMSGAELSEATVTELQQSYDELASCRDALALLTAVGEEVHEVVETVSEAPSEKQPGAIASPFYTPETVQMSPTQRFAARATRNPETLFTKKATRPHTLELVTQSIAAHPLYKQVITHFFGSPAICEAKLLREIEKRERPSKLDAVLGITYKSPFHSFLKDLTLTEIAELEAESREDMSERVLALQLDYTVYRGWLADIPYMHELVRPHAAMTFAELYVRAELEILYTQLEALR